MDKAMKDLKRHIKEVTVDLDEDSYIEFMTELGIWATDEAEKAEYRLPIETEKEY